jgi:hypothetical protein
MTAKEKLRARVEDLSEQEAEATLDFIASRGQSFGDWLDARPEDDASLSAEDQAALAESDADIAAGRTLSYEQVTPQLLAELDEVCGTGGTTQAEPGGANHRP